MTTYYFNRADYRAAMRDPRGSARAHAICRRLTGCAQDTASYGALYWAACAMLEGTDDADDTYYRCWLRDGFGAADKMPEELKRDLWLLACERVDGVLEEAKALASSVLW